MPLFGTPLLTAAGRALVTGRLAGSGVAPGYLGWGTGTAAPALANTTLGAEVPSRAAAVVTAITGPLSGLANAAAQYVATLSAASTVTIAEIGLFDAASAGTLVLRALLASPTVFVSGDTLTVTATLEFS